MLPVVVLGRNKQAFVGQKKHLLNKYCPSTKGKEENLSTLPDQKRFQIFTKGIVFFYNFLYSNEISPALHLDEFEIYSAKNIINYLEAFRSFPGITYA